MTQVWSFSFSRFKLASNVDILNTVLDYTAAGGLGTLLIELDSDSVFSVSGFTSLFYLNCFSETKPCGVA